MKSPKTPGEMAAYVVVAKKWGRRPSRNAGPSRDTRPAGFRDSNTSRGATAPSGLGCGNGAARLSGG